MALTVFPRYSELGRALFPSAGYIVRSLFTAVPPTPPVIWKPGRVDLGVDLGGPREEGGSVHQELPLASTPHSSSCSASSLPGPKLLPFQHLRCCVPGAVLLLEPCLHRPCTTHAQTYTHTHSLTAQGFRDTYPFTLGQSKPPS